MSGRMEQGCCDLQFIVVIEFNLRLSLGLVKHTKSAVVAKLKHQRGPSRASSKPLKFESEKATLPAVPLDDRVHRNF